MGACMVVPRATFNRIGGMDERFYMNSEEVDFQYRLSNAGVDRYLIPSVTVTHEGGGSSPSARRIQWLTTARFIYADKWGWEKKLAVALRATSYANFLVNSVRGLRNKDVDARASSPPSWSVSPRQSAARTRRETCGIYSGSSARFLASSSEGAYRT